MKYVKKKWGSERILVNTNLYCLKILELKKGWQCSIHKHKIKDETFFLVDGKMRLEYGKRSKIMKPGDVHRLKPNTWHRFTGLKNSRFFEVSTKDRKSDSYRRTESGKAE